MTTLHLYDLFGSYVTTCHGWGDLARYVERCWPWNGEVVDGEGRTVGTVARGRVTREGE